MKTNSEYLTVLYNEVRKQLPNITNQELQFYLVSHQEPRIANLDKKDAVEQLLDKIEYAFEVYFSKDSSKIAENLKKAIISYILEHFNAFSIQDIAFAFKRATIEYNFTQALTLKYFCSFIHQWQNVKLKIWNAQATISKQIQEQKQALSKYNEFEQKCIKKYNESLEAGEWLGDLFESNYICKLVEHHLDDEQQQDFKLLAKRQRIELEEIYNQNLAKARSKKEVPKLGDTKIEDILFATEERLYAKLVCESAVFNQVII